MGNPKLNGAMVPDIFVSKQIHSDLIQMNVVQGSKSQESWRQKPVALESWWDAKSADIYRIGGVHDKQGAVVK